MKNFNAKQSGSEVILEEVNPHRPFLRYHIDNIAWMKFTPLILTSIDPNIKVGQVIREDQLEILKQTQYPFDDDFSGIVDVDSEEFPGVEYRKVAKLKQPVHETPRMICDKFRPFNRVETPIQPLETCTEKEEKVTGETPIQEDPKFLSEDVAQRVKDAVKATMQGMWNWVASDDVFIQDKVTKVRIEYAEIESTGVSPLAKYINPELEKFGMRYENITDCIPVQEHKPESEENESELFEEAYKLIIDCYFSSQVVDVFAEFKKQGFKITKKK